MKPFAVSLVFVIIIGSAVLSAQQLTDDQIRQLLNNQPPAAATADAQRVAKDGVAPPIEVDWIKADLDGSGLFQFLIARYAVENGLSGYLRVFQQQGGSLVLKGDEEKPEHVAAGALSQISLADVNGDGIPEIKTDSVSHDAADQLFSLFTWTGSSLHNMFGGEVMNGNLTDLDGDGILEIVVREDGPAFKVYKLSGIDYHLDRTVGTDPTGFTDATGNFNYVRTFCKTLDPGKFPLSEIRQALASKQQNGNAVVHFRFGGLDRVDVGPVDVGQIDQTSISVSPNLRPLRVTVQAKGSNEPNTAGCRQALPPRMDVEISRTDLLKSLPRLSPDAPLAAGDQVEIELSGKLVDGTPFSATFTADILGPQNSKN